MPSTNKSYSVQAEKQENIGGVGAVSGFPGAVLLSMRFTAAKVSGRSRCNISHRLSIPFISLPIGAIHCAPPAILTFDRISPSRACAREVCKKLGFYQVRKMWPLAEPIVILHSQHFYPWRHRYRLCYLAPQTENTLN